MCVCVGVAIYLLALVTHAETQKKSLLFQKKVAKKTSLFLCVFKVRNILAFYINQLKILSTATRIRIDRNEKKNMRRKLPGFGAKTKYIKMFGYFDEEWKRTQARKIKMEPNSSA